MKQILENGNFDQVKVPRGVILPNSTLKTRWDIWIIVLVLYNVFFTPLTIGFDFDPAKLDGDPVFSCTNSPRCGGFDDAAASWAGIDDSPPVVPPFATDDEGDYVSRDGFDYINDDEWGLGF